MVDNTKGLCAYDTIWVKTSPNQLETLETLRQTGNLSNKRSGRLATHLPRAVSLTPADDLLIAHSEPPS